LNIFDYKGFRQNENAVWFAKQLDIKSCMFCNAQFATVIETENRSKVNFQFDHFYPKSKYPYLSMSIFNMVPICSHCNLTKSNRETIDVQNPYLRSFDAFSKFSVSNVEVIKMLVNPTYKPSKLLQLKVLDKQDERILEKHEKLFEITAKHEIHEDYIQEIIWKSNVYTNEYQKQLKNLLPQLSDNDFKRFIIGNYVEKENIFKRPLSKLTRDIAEQLWLI